MDPEFYDHIQQSCLLGIWSKGVSLARSRAVILDRKTAEEIVLRVRGTDHPVSRKVTLWVQDEDWFCDCESKTDVCAHVAAAVIALKTGEASSSNGTDEEGHVQGPVSTSISVHYRLTRKEGMLWFERWLVWPSQSPGKGPAQSPAQSREEILSGSLVSQVGGISSGRISSLPIAATREDYAIDAILADQQRGFLPTATLQRLFKVLAEGSRVELDGKRVEVSAKPYRLRVVLLDEEDGFRLKQERDPRISEAFKNGAVIDETTLRAVETLTLTPAEREILSGSGTFFSSQPEVVRLISEVIPSLQQRVDLEVRAKKLPQLVHAAPRIVLQLEQKDGGESLEVVPQLVYGELSQRLAAKVIFVPDPAEVQALTRKLQRELQVSLGQRVVFTGWAAVDFVQKAREWETAGSAKEAFTVQNPLSPQIQVDSNGNHLGITFESDGKKADPSRVFQAWRENASLVPLLGGGWAPLPQNWLSRYGDRIEALMAAQANGKNLPAYFLPEVIQICDESGQAYPDPLRNLGTLLHHVEQIQSVALPADFTGSLRPYQETGVKWLCFLRQAEMGALLADDMGLGKTLQALCAIQGRTLIVAPTSVLQSWEEQTRKFRPGLSLSLYYGPQRKLDDRAAVIVTSYGLLRLDQDLFHKQKWNTIILDEAQTIKNPESQISRAAHRLQAEFKIALTGTPIENRLDDLWSQFEFINPGLLGSRETFQEDYAEPISRGDQQTIQRLKKRMKPFILRRLKKEVLNDLPPKTEKVLFCELSAKERELYDALWISARKEVLEKLESTGNVFSALELLLRLRQACCHPGLIPGVSEKEGQISSSKTNLLMETLEESIALGHRSLVFSQWTSYLDLIEKELKACQIWFSRLDGSTSNRGAVITDFQQENGPSVLLISLKAGGVGLTLTAADQIFIMDPWWNPAVEEQAADRAHRIGQKQPVLVHRLVARESIEERVLDLQKSKAELAAAILSEGQGSASLTREDILTLLK